MSHVSKEGYGAIPDYKEIADQSKKVAILQVAGSSVTFHIRSLIFEYLRMKSFLSVSALS